MRMNHVKRRLAAGEPSIGTWLGIPSPESAEHVSALGFDWLTVDTEHNPIDIRTASQMFGAIAGAGVAPLVRIPWNSPENFKRVLDAGAWGGAVLTIAQLGFLPNLAVQQPEIQITSVRTSVSVPDGGTLLLGGQTIAGEIEQEQGVPVLSKIPFLKRLFTNRSMAKDEQILLILVKPAIIIQKEIEQQQFPLLSSRPNQ